MGPEARAYAPPSGVRWRRGHAALLLALLMLFAGRVTAQLLQRLWPTPFLPSFDAWQSGLLPYGLLLASQLIILLAIAHQAVQIWRGRTVPLRRVGTVLLVLGAVYFAGASFRLAAGLSFLSDQPFFAAYLPSLFHMVLAAVVLVLGDFHFRGAASKGAGGVEGAG
jgi:hypothetical protein